MYYNRTVSTTLATELGTEGAFGFLLQLTKTWHLVDLQLRVSPKSHGVGQRCTWG